MWTYNPSGGPWVWTAKTSEGFNRKARVIIKNRKFVMERHLMPVDFLSF